MAKTSNRALIFALEPGESVKLRGAKMTSVRSTATNLSRDTGRLFTVSAAKGQPIVVSRIK